ncbi:MAG: hypothetical protein V2A74_09730, partial [bacterium]
ALSLALLFVAMTFINGLPEDWWAGYSFGGRRFCNQIPYLALGAGAGLAWLRRRRWAKAAGALLIAGAVANFLLSALYYRNVIDHSLYRHQGHVWDLLVHTYLSRPWDLVCDSEAFYLLEERSGGNWLYALGLIVAGVIPLLVWRALRFFGAQKGSFSVRRFWWPLFVVVQFLLLGFAVDAAMRTNAHPENRAPALIAQKKPIILPDQKKAPLRAQDFIYLHDMLKSSPRNHFVRFLLVNHLVHVGDNQGARMLMEPLLREGWKDAATYALQTEGAPDRERKLIELWMKDYSQDRFFTEALVQEALELKAPDLVKDRLAICFDKPDIFFFYLGKSLELEGKNEEAAQAFRKAFRYNPMHLENYRMLVARLRANGEATEADRLDALFEAAVRDKVDLFRHYIVETPDLVESVDHVAAYFYRYLAIYYYEKGRYREARDLFIEGSHLEAFRAEAKSYIRLIKAKQEEGKSSRN